jgi:tetratricopeptide (TPR) repeat protein
VIPAGSLSAALALVECYQEMVRYEEAIGVLQQLIALDGDPALRVSLCELYAEAEDWEEIVQLAAGTENADDLTLQTLLYLGCAHAELEQDEEALEVYARALSSRRRPEELLMEARYERGRTQPAARERARGARGPGGDLRAEPGLPGRRQVARAGDRGVDGCLGRGAKGNR